MGSKVIDITDRLTYLAEEFDVFDCDLGEVSLAKKTSELATDNYEVSMIKNHNEIVIALLSKKVNKKERILKKVSISSDIFTAMIAADPTENKIYLQWMLNVFSSMIKGSKENSILSAIRFVEEDLPQANVYLTLFEDNKRKKKFVELCKVSYGLKHVTDPANINQYKSLSQLFDAVDPFIEKEPSAIQRTLFKYVADGQAVIPVSDRKFTLYIPKTTAASIVFKSFASWCTAREQNGMFDSYTHGNKKPNGKNSDIYIIINNEFFTGESKELYQIHFETGQLKDRKNSEYGNIFEDVISKSDGISNFFYEELMTMAKQNKKGLDNNKYLDFLVRFGFTESLFEIHDENEVVLKFMNRDVPKLPDISKFKELDELVIVNAKMVDLHPSIGKLSKLQLIAFPENRIKSIPREIGSLKNLVFFNLVGNPIEDIPDEITYLDKSNGGSLTRICFTDLKGNRKIDEESYEKIKRLLPTTIIS